MRKFLLLVLAVVLLNLHANAQQIFFRISMDSSGTGGISPGTGSGYAWLSSDLKTLTYQITVNKLQGSITAAHFHVFPSTAVVQAITFTGNTASGTWSNVPDSILYYLFASNDKARNLYVNVHTSTASGGEIRGRVQPHQAGFSVKIDSTGAGTGSPGKGSGFVVFQDSSGVPAIQYRFTYAGLKGNITASHFHSLPGGAVIKPITFTDSTADGYWTNYPDSVITLLLKGKVYVNIHTTFAGGGEIRGIPILVGEFPFIADIDGAQAGTASTAKGTAWVVLVNDLSKVKYSVTYARLQGTYSASHFHSSPSSSIVQAITFTGNSANGDWLNPSDANIVDFFRGRIYVNIHSSTASAGEIRGNLKLNDGTFTAKLDGAQAGTSSNGKGTAWVTINEDTLKLRLTIAGLTGTFSAAHIHGAPSGSILQTINFTDSSGVLNWYPYADSIITLLVKGKLYANVHSSTNSGGEIRGNIGPGSAVLTSVEQVSSAIPASFSLEQNYPNPFNPATIVNFSLQKAGRANLKIFNLLGQEVATLLDEIKDAGSYRVTFNANSLPSGLYFYRLTVDGGISETKKMVLLK